MTTAPPPVEFIVVGGDVPSDVLLALLADILLDLVGDDADERSNRNATRRLGD